MLTLDFSRSYFRFYIDLEGGRAISLSHRPPTRTNRTRILLESTCRLTHRVTGKTTLYALSAACKSERVGASKGELWITPNADVIFLLGDDGEFAIYKSWFKNDPGVMRHPTTLGPQPERQTFRAEDNFDDLAWDLREVEAEPLTSFADVAAAILGTQPIVSRIAYTDGDYDIVIDQPVKTINLAEKDDVFQTDTGPILVPDLTPERRARETHAIGIFDLAYSAWHSTTWAEVVLKRRTPLAAGLSVNHYAYPRLLDPTHNTLLLLP